MAVRSGSSVSNGSFQTVRSGREARCEFRTAPPLVPGVGGEHQYPDIRESAGKSGDDTPGRWPGSLHPRGVCRVITRCR
ncbi:hypothetical protein Cus16_3239 [Curtobacterium sp. ER1/6]|nr:hypothetical protein Cus16_3239 [Curtobacterium sp. ER1/6]